ncbi:YdcF family protein [Magnetospirillum sp. J10]|uniref:YdcF family protein n=1 Tax=Magnetospirillum sulfuroxidans TaxID=611300 RepID=A0ABS5I884_9PROT|nr:YdcF family protein [Magnetospirillum sulfuroxidans]
MPVKVEFDCAIVLGAKVLTDGTPSAALARRVAHATELARRGQVRHLLMSGGPVNHPTPEAHVMRDLAVAAGIAAERVLVEDRSRDTIGNARCCVPIIAAHGWQRLLVVTDRFHLPRARLIFRHHGLSVTGSGASPERISAEWLLSHAREVPAMLKTLVRLTVEDREQHS